MRLTSAMMLSAKVFFLVFLDKFCYYKNADGILILHEMDLLWRMNYVSIVNRA